MKMTLRWYGPEDKVTLKHIRQIPLVEGIVTALYDIPIGEVWPLDRLQSLDKMIRDESLTFSVIESIPVHEDIKLGRPSRDQLIRNYIESLKNAAAVGVPVVCYNFMPVFDWTRTNLASANADGSTCLSYDSEELKKIDLSQGTGSLPGWSASYDKTHLNQLLSAYKDISEEKLWDNLAYFLVRVIPEAEKLGIKMGVHPDDPPWSIFGLPRIIRNEAALARYLSIVDSPSHGLTFCTGSLGASEENDLPAMIRKFGKRIVFAHCRNVLRSGSQSFREVPHPSCFGSVNMREVIRAYKEIGFSGPMRPDHGRMIWGETGRPGYGLYDRALGATYLLGLWEGMSAS